MNVLIAYYSVTGNTEKMAQGVAERAKTVSGTNVVIKRVGEVIADDLLSYDAVVVGSPVYFGNMAGDVKTFLDNWLLKFDFFREFKMQNKVGGAFATGGSISNGKEITMMAIPEAMQAAILAERAVSLNPNISLAWAVLGWIHNWLGEPDRACDAFDQAARLNPLDRVTLVGQILPGTSFAYFLLGRQDQWLMCVNRLLALDPSNLGGLLDALYLARQQGRMGDAEKLLQRIEALYPDLRSSQVRELSRLRKPEHQVLFDQWLSRLALRE